MSGLVKYIVFEDERKRTGESTRFFSENALNYRRDGAEFAIGMNCSCATAIDSYSPDFDLFLFEDAEGPPSIFLSTFCKAFFQNRGAARFRTVFHLNSGWDYFGYFDPQTIKEDYSDLSAELTWLRSLRQREFWIKQSHLDDDVYHQELNQICSAIADKNGVKYRLALEKLDKRFGDPVLEMKLELLQSVINDGTCSIEMDDLTQSQVDQIEWFTQNKSADIYGDEFQKRFRIFRDSLEID